MDDVTDYTKWRFYFDVLQSAAMVAVAIYTWFVNRQKASRHAIDELRVQLQSVEKKVDLQDNDIRHLPDHHDLEKIHEKVNSVANSMHDVHGQLTGITRTLGLINDHLLGRKK